MPARVELTNEELVDIFAATQALRNNARTIEFANLTLNDVRDQALSAIGEEEGAQPSAPAGAPNAVAADNTAEPPGKLTRLSRLKNRVDQLFENIENRQASGRKTVESRSV